LGFRLLDGRRGAIERGRVVPRVDPDEHLVGGHDMVVVGLDGDRVARDPRRQNGNFAMDVGVLSALHIYRAMDKSLQIRRVIVIHDGAECIHDLNVRFGHPRRGQAPRNQEHGRVGMMAEAHVAKSVRHALRVEDAVGERELAFRDGDEIDLVVRRHRRTLPSSGLPRRFAASASRSFPTAP
jgi:hypothetical protein